MDPKWNEDLPIYRQLRDRVVAMILEGVLDDGDALPSVRNVAAEYRLNPLTVLKGYQELVDEGLVEKKRGRGMFVTAVAQAQLMKNERGRCIDNRFSGFSLPFCFFVSILFFERRGPFFLLEL